MSESTSEPVTERHRDFERFLTFVDAIVAIAITLLVLPLVELTGDLSADESVRDLLRHHQPEIWSFFLSFAVIARLWFVQHDMVRDVVVNNDDVVRRLLLWTVTIVFLPFPTALVAKDGHEALTKVLYVGTIMASMVFLTLVGLAIRKNVPMPPGAHVPGVGGGVASIIALAIALVIMLLWPGASYFPMLILALEGIALGWVSRLREGRNPLSRMGE